MIHLGEFLSSRCPVWYTRGSSSDCFGHLISCDLPGMRHRYGGDLLKELQGRKIDIPLVIVLESNYVAFWINNLIFFGCVLNCSLSFTPLNLFQQIHFSTCPRIPSEHTQSKRKCTSSFFGPPSRSLLSCTPSEFFRKALLCNRPSFVARFLVHILLKIYSCRATFEAIPVPLDPAFSVCNGFDDRYKI